MRDASDNRARAETEVSSFDRRTLLTCPQVDYLFITDVLTPIGSPLEAPGPWGKVVVQIPSRAGVEIESIWAEAKLVAINAAAKKWPGIVRLQDSGKLVLEDCNWDADALREPFYEDSLGRAWMIDPDQGSHEDR